MNSDLIHSEECQVARYNCIDFWYKLDLATVKSIDEYNNTYWYKILQISSLSKTYHEGFYVNQVFLLVIFIDAVRIRSNIYVW